MRASLLGGVFLFVAGFASLAAQTTSNNTSTEDLDLHSVNGGSMPGLDTSYSHSGGTTTVTETRQSLNGHSVPAERVEEHVVSDSGGVRVVERMIQRYDPNGNPLAPEKEVVTTSKLDDGSTDERKAVWRGDINGSMALTEQTEAKTRREGATVTSEITVARPSMNASMDVVEKRDLVRTLGLSGSYQQDETVWRNGESGFYEAVRRVVEHKEDANRTLDNIAEYELGSSGALELHRQMVRDTVKGADGSQTTSIKYLDQSAPGTVISGSDPGLKLSSEEIVQRSPGSGGSVVETMSVRRPSLSDPNELQPAQKVSETVCRGDCSPDHP
jgi:hypothetical protein